LFSCDHLAGEPAANDDIIDVAWFKMENLAQMIADGLINDEHTKMLKLIITKYLNN
jgi:bifunctional NMN adenylyltransferase/nudix hydrolase